MAVLIARPFQKLKSINGGDSPSPAELTNIDSLADLDDNMKTNMKALTTGLIMTPFLFLLIVPIDATLPKSQRGLRCTNPFCDFECLHATSGSTWGDLGADVDIDEQMVPVACAFAFSCY